MASLVKKILRGRQRIETDRVIAFRSHRGYQSEYCNPASGNEKGGVKGELGWYRRNCLVLVPEAADLAALNQQLLAACVAKRGRTISGKNMTVGQASEHERTRLSPLSREGFPIHETLYPLVVDGKGRLKVKTNWYHCTLRSCFATITTSEISALLPWITPDSSSPESIRRPTSATRP